MQRWIFVCYANYCRSPVAEKILNSFNSNSIKATSAGLINFSANTMDIRSKEYLENLGINDTYHIPRKLTQETVNQTDLIIAMDLMIFQKLFTQYKIHTNKVKAVNIFNPNITIHDPYKFNDLNQYRLCMKDIKVCIESLVENVNQF
tara:strand:+ start:88 stop:528 length:441 start_codon:yes stop_codon:yes gene_type:complete